MLKNTSKLVISNNEITWPMTIVVIRAHKLLGFYDPLTIALTVSVSSQV